MPQAIQLDKAGKLKLSEADIVRQVCDFLEAHGWRVLTMGYGEIINNKGEVVGTVGEVGMPDRLCVRYGAGSRAELIWLEFKRAKCKGDSGGKLRQAQKEWLMIERVYGATVLVVDDLVTFLDWYRRAGLAKLPAKVAEVGG